VEPIEQRHSRGRRAEAAAVAYLEAAGYEILARNLRLGALEIDIVARKGDLVAVVEVRTRGAGAYEGALASLAGKKRLYLLRAAERLWRTRFSKMLDVTRIRIDVAVVRFEGEEPTVEYFAGAITA
jgi:putative endonuclease